MLCPKCNNIMRKVPIKEHIWMCMNKGYRYMKIGEELVRNYCVMENKETSNENQNTESTATA